jgi:hypothetical protein
VTGVLVAAWIETLVPRSPFDPPVVPTGLASAGARLPSERELRASDGVGAIRSRRLARAMWERGPGFDERWLESVEGIGPVTAASIWKLLQGERDGTDEWPRLPPRLPPPVRAP